ncbi:hypothetical protein MNBD_GAMMA06-1853 [hydrothermal vent metagenome]|uniref:Two-component transcriptional response regulator, LuxR family n=1 Tax=hydrothermal vent metagenome TaxID=652676 RepID=A0A3B0W4C5_9ZZZZ
MLILLADDHELMREGVKLVLGEYNADFTFIEAQDYTQTLNHLKTSQPIDIILLDLAMPGMERLQGLKQVRRSAPSIPIIVLSMFESADDVKAALSCGANGYVPKSSASKILPDAINLVMQGETYLPDTSQTKASITTGTQFNYAANPKAALIADELTDRQQQVLQLLSAGCANKEIADKLNISEPTVKTHLSNIYKILNISNRTEAVRAAFDLGLI